MFEPLRAAIVAQYEAFGAARPQTVVGCEYCTTPGELRALVAKPREELGARELDFYARKALTTNAHVQLQGFSTCPSAQRELSG